MHDIVLQMIQAAILASESHAEQMFDAPRRARIRARAQLYPTPLLPNQWAQLRDVEVLFTTWGMPHLTTEQLEQLPALRAVFYAAGSVQSFAQPLLERGITLVSAWQANAVPVAEFTLAQILLANKGYFRNAREYRAEPQRPREAYRGPGNYGETVALLGMGAVGRAVRELLRPFQLRVMVFDPFLSEAAVAALGVEKVSLEEAFAQGFVVSNHVADKPETAGMLRAEHFARLRPGATFINTGRGRTLVERELVAVLQARPDLTALLDVTFPEPAPPDSALWSLPNAVLTSHIAGSIQDETRRMVDYCLDEFERYVAGSPLRYAVTQEMLATMA